LLVLASCFLVTIGFFFDDKGFAQSTTMNGIWLGKIYDDDHNNFKALLSAFQNTFTLTLLSLDQCQQFFVIFFYQKFGKFLEKTCFLS
jgi:hypothetical protein